MPEKIKYPVDPASQAVFDALESPHLTSAMAHNLLELTNPFDNPVFWCDGEAGSE